MANTQTKLNKLIDELHVITEGSRMVLPIDNRIVYSIYEVQKRKNYYIEGSETYNKLQEIENLLLEAKAAADAAAGAGGAAAPASYVTHGGRRRRRRTSKTHRRKSNKRKSHRRRSHRA